MMSNIHPTYRPDIDGLRAVAVLSVIGFHAFPSSFRGGFVGVDIFFVISGFLISTIIFQGVTRGTFSYADFYARRIKRIFPALIVILAFCLLFGWYDTFTVEFVQIAKHVAAGAAFVANITFWRESGYFARASELKPLLHLWSLGIEEQYYILWPLFVAALYRKTNRLLLVICIVLFASFALNIILIRDHSAATFFLPATRFWELMLGSLLAYRAVFSDFSSKVAGNLENYSKVTRQLPPYLREALSLTGLVLVSASIFLLDKQRLYPGWWALAPTMGAASIIAAGPDAWVNRRLLSKPVMVFFGLISYPLYLWHWPLLSFLKIDRGNEPSDANILMAVVTSVALAWLTYKFIERPIRFGSWSRSVTAHLCVILAIIGAIGYFASRNATTDNPRDQYVYYFEDNTSPNFRYSTSHDLQARYRNDCSFFNTDGSTKPAIDRSCYTPVSDHTVLIWGDSHAAHLNFGLATALPKNVSILQIATASCSPALKMHTDGRMTVCDQSNEFAIQKISEIKPDLVIIAQFSQHEITDWDRVSIALKNLGAKNIILVGPVPRWTSPLPRIVARHYWPNPPSRISTNLSPKMFSTNKVLETTYAASSYFTYVSLIDQLCNTDGCLAFVGSDIREDVIYHDSSHFTAAGSVYVGEEILAPAVRKLMWPDTRVAR